MLKAFLNNRKQQYTTVVSAVDIFATTPPPRIPLLANFGTRIAA